MWVLIQQVEGKACYCSESDNLMVRKSSMEQDKFRPDLASCVTSKAEELWEEHSGMRGGQPEVSLGGR